VGLIAVFALSRLGLMVTSLAILCHHTTVCRFAVFALSRLGLMGLQLQRRIVIIDRQPYLAHPRLATPLPALASRSMSNKAELIKTLQADFPADEARCFPCFRHDFDLPSRCCGA
jgi:hypothetical protein